MSALLKAHQQLDVRARRFTDGKRLTEQTAAAPSDVERLQQEKALLQEAYEELEQSISDQLEAAKRQAREAALSERSNAEAEQLKMLETATREAADSLDLQFAALREMAPLIAQTVLERIFGDSSKYAEQVEMALETFCARAESAAAIRFRVSPSDFSEGQLDSLRTCGKVLALDASLASGQCMADLTFGHIDLSPSEQWRNAVELFESLTWRSPTP